MNWFSALLVSVGLLKAPTPPETVNLSPSVQACIKPCAVSDEGYALVRTFEGYMPFPYKDVAGIETVGYGYVLRPGDKFTYPLLPLDADALLKREMRLFERDMNQLVRVRLYQNQFDALGSFTYNVGGAALGSSTLLKRINLEQHDLVPDGFLMWNKARIGGVLQPVKGLTLRRQQEANLYAGN